MLRRESMNSGFYKYTQPLLFQCLHEYIQPYLQDIGSLGKTDPHFINPSVNLLLYKYVLCVVLSKLVEFYDKLQSEDPEVVTMLENRFLEKGEDMDIYECVSLAEECIMDLFINLFEVHYDSRWIVSNHNLDDLSQRLSKQKEKEKQQLIQNLDTMSDEKRASTVELQKIGAVSMYHQAASANEQRIIDEYSSVDEGFDEISNKEVVDAAISVSTGELTELQVPQQTIELEPIEEGYYDPNDFDEDGVTGDEMQEFDQEDQYDNDFNV